MDKTIANPAGSQADTPGASNTPGGQGPPARWLLLSALIAGNVALALGPWSVRLADSGPVSAAFWRLFLALPFLALLARTNWSAADENGAAGPIRRGAGRDRLRARSGELARRHRHDAAGQCDPVRQFGQPGANGLELRSMAQIAARDGMAGDRQRIGGRGHSAGSVAGAIDGDVGGRSVLPVGGPVLRRVSADLAKGASRAGQLGVADLGMRRRVAGSAGYRNNTRGTGHDRPTGPR